jgi:uncharacterized protein (TIGR03083 family)
VPTELDYLTHLGSDSRRFVEVLRDVDGSRPVPTCPDWTADDLLFHLAKVQSFWARIVRERITDESAAVDHDCPRPADRAGLLTLFDRASADLYQALASTPPETTVWSWAHEQTAGFSRRRQAHEALIHRLDAELTAGARTELHPALAADGVAEALTVMYGDPPAWGEMALEGDHVVQFLASDTGDSYQVAVGRFTGVGPVSGKANDFWCLDQAPSGSQPTLQISGSAEDLDCWLWRRPPRGSVDIEGDQQTLAKLQSVIEDGIS